MSRLDSCHTNQLHRLSPAARLQAQREDILRRADWGYKLIRWVLGGIFIYAGSTKLLAPEIFAVLIEAFGLVPDRLIMPMAIVLPTLEVIAGVVFIYGWRRYRAIRPMSFKLIINKLFQKRRTEDAYG
jgi:hypothetical protein